MKDVVRIRAFGCQGSVWPSPHEALDRISDPMRLLLSTALSKNPQLRSQDPWCNRVFGNFEFRFVGQERVIKPGVPSIDEKLNRDLLVRRLLNVWVWVFSGSQCGSDLRQVH